MVEGYRRVWKVLDGLLTELRARGVVIPSDIVNNLRSAKTMIEILKAGPKHLESIQRIEVYLGNVESYLIFVCEDRFGGDYAQGWMKRLEEARKIIFKDLEPREAVRFIPGVPRGKHWVRVKVSEEIPRGEVERLAEENSLSYRLQEDGCLLIYGDGAEIKSFIKMMADKLRGVKGSKEI